MGFYKNKIVLVTGSTGLVGTNLTKKLINIRANVLSTYFSNEPTYFKGNDKRFDFTKFVNCIESTIEHEVDPAILRPSDVTIQIPDTSKFQAVTGGIPEILPEITQRNFLEYNRNRVKTGIW